jgi:aryl carrier-like protein
LWTAFAGGLLAGAVVAWAEFRKWRTRGQAADVKFVPYAPAITLGAWLSLIPK